MPVSFTWPDTLPGPADDDYQWDEEPRVRMAKFGDGYEQRSPDGLNTRPRSLSLSWPNLSTTQKNTLVDFVRARNGAQAFFWTPPGEGSAIKIKCPKWTIKRTSGPWWSVSCEFVEVFDQ